MTKEYHLQIIAWKQKEDYTEGLRLWKQRYGENITYRALCLGMNDFNREKLREGLFKDIPDKIEKELTKKKLDSGLKALGTSVEDLESDVDDLKYTISDLQEKVDELLEKRELTLPAKKADGNENDPAEIKKIRESTHGLMDERTLLKQKLRDLPDPGRREDRRIVAYRILEITTELDRLFGIIGYYEEFGRVPEKVGFDDDVIAYPREYLNMRTYVSRTTKKLEFETDKQRRADLEQKIENWVKRMEQIEIDL
jgi:predicted  nucleic acid-binding Zn-ribbon protein